MSPSQSATSQLGWCFHTVRSSIDPRDPHLRPQVVGISCRDMEGFLTRGWELILSECGGTSALSRGASLAARWIHEPQPISNQPLGWGFPHLAGRYRPKRSSLSSPGCWSCGDMEGYLTRGWEIIIPGCGGTSALSRGETLAACWLHEPQPISNQPVWLGFPYLAGRYRPGGSPFPSPGCWSCGHVEGVIIRG